MGREFELKYRAVPEQLAAIREHFGNFSPIAMETVYYDVPGGVLGRRRWTLRRRMENGVSVCTVKTNLPDGSRGEWEVICPEILQAIPQLIAAGAPAELAELTAQGVEEVCGARFTRLAAHITQGEAEVEIALDEGCLLGGGRTEALCEAEVEQKGGTDEATVAFAQALADRFGLTPEPNSKLKRARALAGL